MRVSVPTIPDAVLRAAAQTPTVSPAVAVDRIARFFEHGHVAVLTGAGVSVDSGIRAYRGEKGSYLNPNYKPIFYHELMEATPRGASFRQRYWLRSYLGYPPVRDAQPNPTHFALAALQYASVAPHIITQNVDGLHHKAIRTAWDDARRAEGILELHGTLHSVKCSHGHPVDRQGFQDMIGVANPQWKAYAEQLERSDSRPRTNPDGDVVLPEGTRYDQFVVPECTRCLQENRHNSMLKPEVIFFGESISAQVKDKSFEIVDTHERLFIVGTTLATFSAYRLVKHAIEKRKPVLVLNIGPTRAHELAGIEIIELPAGAIFREVVKRVLGSTAERDPVISRLLTSGIVKTPPDDYDDPIP
ncbi:DHS-like NAD/FAD-binding domain-containing protein [Trametes versicolor FP-101664 SS1]|uniref:DHS-like NAD/FAD-binding domain-containing protein n=1 Tax=Trametes versicolor (strain FP-101664) TaxID=717944 RepID=UPI0004623412|nr:DHS-like NAD/FAD-binding domain-containing protein [Trametes versicolor FP-101664 SS1]EIW58551.1 DHS-like NAD/FAD-binding domain-containing protein [Trametes versicolor FP-101664 SS1]